MCQSDVLSICLLTHSVILRQIPDMEEKQPTLCELLLSINKKKVTNVSLNICSKHIHILLVTYISLYH